MDGGSSERLVLLITPKPNRCLFIFPLSAGCIFPLPSALLRPASLPPVLISCPSGHDQDVAAALHNEFPRLLFPLLSSKLERSQWCCYCSKKKKRKGKKRMYLCFEDKRLSHSGIFAYSPFCFEHFILFHLFIDCLLARQFSPKYYVWEHYTFVDLFLYLEVKAGVAMGGEGGGFNLYLPHRFNSFIFFCFFTFFFNSGSYFCFLKRNKAH